MMFREFLVRHRKQVVEVVRWQSLDAKAHDHLLVLTEAILALQPRDTTRFLTRVFTKPGDAAGPRRRGDRMSKSISVNGT
jgi:hypothetical protein